MSPYLVSAERVRVAALSRGWMMGYSTTPHDEDSLVKDIPPLRLEAHLQLRELPNGIHIEANPSISRPDFSGIVSAIMNEPQTDRFPLEVWNLSALADRSLHQFENILGQLLADLEKHAASFDWNAKLEHFIHHRPDRPLTPQLAHLAALAFKGDLIQLLGYQDAFARGKRLNFGTMITADVIDRAVDIAALRYAVSAHLP